MYIFYHYEDWSHYIVYHKENCLDSEQHQQVNRQADGLQKFYLSKF